MERLSVAIRSSGVRDLVMGAGDVDSALDSRPSSAYTATLSTLVAQLSLTGVDHLIALAGARSNPPQAAPAAQAQKASGNPV